MCWCFIHYWIEKCTVKQWNDKLCSFTEGSFYDWREFRCCVSPVGIGGTTVIAVTRNSIQVSIPGKDRNACLPHSMQTGSGTHPFSGYWRLSMGIKRAEREAYRSPVSHTRCDGEQCSRCLVTYTSGVPRIFFGGGGFNKFSWEQRTERTGIWGR